MIALILFLSTTVFVPIYIIILFIPLIFIRQFLLKKNMQLNYGRPEVLGYALVGLAACFIVFFNLFFGSAVSNIQENSILGEIPYIILLFFSLIFSKFLNLKDLRIIQILIFIEIFVGVLEYAAGVPTFFRNLTPVTELADSDLLYQKKVFGFSANSSVLAAKIVYFATISIMTIKLYKKISLIDKFAALFVIVGLIITFNRTAIFAVFLSLIFLFGTNLRNILTIIFPVFLLLIVKWQDIYEQMTRGKNTVDYSGRDQIFAYFFDFWSNNLLIGNSGTKVWWNSSGSIWHAHNSYLEFLASNGLIASLLFLIGWVLIFGRKTIIALPILIYSLSQYGFLWGLTFYDVVVFAIIFIYVAERKKLILLNNQVKV